jgi:hypothetical protein
LPCVYSRWHGWQKLPTPTGFAFWRGKQNTPHACHPHRLSRRRNQPPSSLAAAPRACLARRLAPPPPHVPPAAAMTQAAVSGREGGTGSRNLAQLPSRRSRLPSRLTRMEEECGGRRISLGHRRGGAIHRRAEGAAGRGPSDLACRRCAGTERRRAEGGLRRGPDLAWPPTWKSRPLSRGQVQPPLFLSPAPAATRSHLPPPSPSSTAEVQSAMDIYSLVRILPENRILLIWWWLWWWRAGRRRVQAGSAHRMHLRREGMHFYISSLLGGKMRPAFPSLLLESYFDRHSADWCCKNGNASSIGLSLRKLLTYL